MASLDSDTTIATTSRLPVGDSSAGGEPGRNSGAWISRCDRNLEFTKLNDESGDRDRMRGPRGRLHAMRDQFVTSARERIEAFGSRMERTSLSDGARRIHNDWGRKRSGNCRHVKK
jgi:hypothetical protein